MRLPVSAIAALLASTALAAPAAARDEDPPQQRDDIIVVGEKQLGETATKSDTPLLETAQSISIIDADRFTEMGAQNLQDVLRYTAGIRTEAYGLDTRGDYGFVRGTEPAIFQDGLRRSFGFRVGSKQEIFTLDRVELLRGPSSMLYGQSPIGGLINSVTKTPQFETSGQAYASYGTFDRKEAAFDLTGPIAGDLLAGRIIGVWRDADSQTDFVGERRLMLNASLAFQPGANTRIVLTGQVQDDDSGWTGQFLPYVANLFATDATRLPWGRNLGEPSQDRVDLSSEWGSLQVEHRFNPNIRFTSSSRIEHFRSDQVLSYADVYSSPTDPYIDPADPYLVAFFPEYAALGAGRVLNRFNFGEVFDADTAITDNRLQFDFATGPVAHKLVAGIDYTEISTSSRSFFGSSTPAFDEDGNPIAPTATPIDAFNPVYGNIIPLDYVDDPGSRLTQFGLYLQDEITVAERATLTLGIRRDRSTSESDGGQRFVDTAWTKRVGLSVDMGHGLHPYLSFSQSFLPVATANSLGEPYRPQRGRQFEGGIKYQPNSRTLITAAVYDMKDSNRLVADPNGGIDQIQAGEIKTQGIEIEGSHRIGEDFDLIAAYSYTRAKDSNLGGRQVESIPEHLASIWASKGFAIREGTRLRLGGGLRYVSESYSDSFDSDFNPFVVTSPDYLLADALIGLEHGPFNLALNATNLFDKQYYTTCLGRGDCFLGLRRTVNLRLGVRF